MLYKVVAYVFTLTEFIWEKDNLVMSYSEALWMVVCINILILQSLRVIESRLLSPVA